jgi:dimeric dUTPase (all-alpha-NTP-PPase superfamily)
MDDKDIQKFDNDTKAILKGFASYIDRSRELSSLMNMQKSLNDRIGVPDFYDSNMDNRAEWTLKFSRALMHEIIELERELPWKHWKKQQKFNIKNAQEEAVDCLHFLLSIFLSLGMTADDVIYQYIKKHEINNKRQESGY